MTIIETSGLTKYYGDLCAVDHLDLSVGNEIFGLLGPNGSGKTTTVLMLTTLLEPTGGSARICGYDTREEAREVRRQISYVPQEMAVDIKLTGRENVAFFAKLYGIPRRDEAVDRVLSMMDLSERADDLVRTYSGGMRRRLELAQALVHEPKVLFLDEPTIGLDVAARRKIWEHIRTLKSRGMTIFVTTHYMDEADHSCDRVAILDRGRVIAVDSPSALRARVGNDIISARVRGQIGDTFPEGITHLGERENGEIVFSTDHGSEKVPVLFHWLEKRGVSVQSISVREPTLDDVFLSLVTQREEGHGFDDHKFRTMLRRR
ncbi:MAG TPA: ATP-binding cassette domain-containing protein [Methanolinea sp.]|jgi:ABC-2 type transport system ATP-binding protein|nr:ATP-binding cassette domain-containing protein [Methanolinea sp.]HPC54909.1 ATP-binding cassette domain-containing protein [Methanolinea sp.]HQE86344.1 ATP-binding cassette domain-containing protein [Methanolinea sp.]HQI15121.1 ATP-binding cassette domain-containing protein [Methanolinea sp.]HQJ19312.1 ATP-binding cassette domain-containing protein [Methanolinea sp.]